MKRLILLLVAVGTARAHIDRLIPCLAVPCIASSRRLPPGAITAGVSSFTLIIEGADFLAEEQILWNGEQLASSHISDSEKRVVIEPRRVAAPGRVMVTLAGYNSLTLIINPRPMITTASPLPSGTPGLPYSQTLAVSDGTAPFTWAFGSGVPAGLGLAITPNGVLRATASAPGDFSIPVQVTDLADVTATKSFAWTVSAPVTTIANMPNSGVVGDPISTATGELFEEETDLTLGGPLSLRLVRYYGSYLKAAGFAGALGNNWMHNFESRFTLGETTGTVTLWRGKKVTFNHLGSTWSLATREKTNYQLANAVNGYLFLDPTENLIYNFSNTGALLRIEDRNGNALTITQSAAGPTQVSDSLGRSLTFAYSSGKLIRVQDQTGRASAFAYSGDDLTSATDANAKTRRYAYTRAGTLVGLMVSKTLPAGNTPLTQTFDSTGRVVRQAASGGQSTTLAYGRPSPAATAITDALGVISQHIHQGQGNLTGHIDPAGQGIVLSYDSSNRLTSVKDRLGDESRTTYHDPSGLPATFTDSEANTTRYTYATQRQGQFTYYPLARIDYPDSSSLSFTYDNSGNPLTITGPAGKRSTFTYNSRGQLLTLTNPAGGVVTFAYNQDGTLASLKNASEETTTFSYDEQKRLARIGHPDGAGMTFAYDRNGNLVRRTDEQGNARNFVYDDNNVLRSTTDALNATTALVHDPDQRVTAVRNALGNTTTFGRDEAGKVKAITNAGGALTIGYDTLGRPGSFTDCTGKGVTLSYDREGVLASANDGLGQTWRFSTDKKGRLTRITSPLARTFEYAYDSLGRTLSQTTPLGHAAAYRYDSSGNLIAVAMPGGAAARFARDELGQLAEITDSNGNGWTTAYGTNGRLLSRKDPLGRVTAYQYDSRGRVWRILLPAGSVDFGYDSTGNLIRRRYSDGIELNYSYDANNRLVSADGVSLAYDAAGRITASNGIAIGRDDVGRIVSVSYAADRTVRYVYDCRGLLIEVADWAGGSTQLSYDDARHLVSVRRPNGVTTQYTYDADGRLAAIVESREEAVSSIALERDAAGRITAAERNLPLPADPSPSVQEFPYDTAAQIADATYDPMGRLVSRAGRTYSWDLASRLTSYSEGETSASFNYDAYGKRVSRSAGGKTQEYIWNYAFLLPTISVVREESADRRYYVQLPDGVLLYSVDAGDNSRRYYHFDEMGSTVFLTDDAGAITDTYAVTPYGEHVARSGNSDNPFTFLGAHGVMEEERTGLYSMRSRIYDSATARFLSRRTALTFDPRAVNPYQYARGNPLLYIDPEAHGGRDASERKAESPLISSFLRAIRRILGKGGTEVPEP